MRRRPLAALLALMLLMAPAAALADGRGGQRRHRTSSSKRNVEPSQDPKTYSGRGNKDKTVEVAPYQRSDGKWVRGHYKHAPDTAPEKRHKKKR